ncbi:MAG: 2-hydroxy-3-oxopropionate reductase [Lachnospirales bacterium]
MQVGFVGLGIMGRPMAKNVLKGGYSVKVFDFNQSAVDDLVSCGATAGTSTADVASTSDVIITMLPNSPHVKAVALGEGGILDGAKSGTTLIDMSSIAPTVSREVAEKLAEKGIDMLDAPVSGGEPKAIDGTIAVMVGGKKETFDKFYDLMMTMAGSVTYVGEIGAGNIAKLCNQVVVAVNIAAVGEALTLAKMAGVSPDLVYQAIRGGLAGSTVMDAKAPLMMDRKFDPGFRIDLHIKDLNNAMETGQATNSPLPLASQTLEMMKILRLDGGGSEDHGSLVKYYEKLANATVTRD